MKHFINKWKNITTDPAVLSYVKGYKIPFKAKVYQKFPPPEKKFSKKDLECILSEIQRLKNLGAVEKCNTCENQYISQIFLVPKPNGSQRLILNLKQLNKFIKTEHFKMEDKNVALKLLTSNCFMALVDLKEAYHLVPIIPEDKKFLRFVFNGQLYQYTVVPFGLCSAPLLFTKLLKPIVASLRERGFVSVNYLDDFLLIGKNYDDCLLNVNITCKLLVSLGFIINREKSVLSPNKNCKFLGFNLNSEKMVVELPREKQEKVKKVISQIQSKDRIRIRKFAHLVSVCTGIAYGILYTKILEREKSLALKQSNGDYNSVMILNRQIKQELSWWQTHLTGAFNPIKCYNFALEIFSDASLTGWGVVCGNKRANGFWNKKEKHCHINELELLAVFFGLKLCAHDLRNKEILLRIDNTTAICYVNRMGGTRFPHLHKIANNIWKWCEERQIWVFASYISSTDNKEADDESRKLAPETEWELADYAFAEIIKTFGKPEVDLFASRINKKTRNILLLVKRSRSSSN